MVGGTEGVVDGSDVLLVWCIIGIGRGVIGMGCVRLRLRNGDGCTVDAKYYWVSSGKVKFSFLA